MSSALELKVLFTAVDRFVRPVKAITGAAGEAAKALRENTARMKELNRTVDQIDAFKKAEKDAAITANTFAKTRRQIDELKAAIDRVGVPTKAQAAELANLTRKSEELRAKHESLTNTEQRLFEKLKAAGVDTAKLAEERRKLASASAEAANASGRLQAALEAENQKMRRLKAAQADLTNSKEKAAKLAATGAGITAAGAAVGLPVGKSVKDFADFETAMLGVARQMDGARDDSGKLTRSYYDMGREIKAMSEKLPMAANDIAAIVEGGARMGIQGKENLLIYARTTAIMADAFKLPVDQIGEDIGRLSQLYKVPIKDIGALGDAINYLDDNALAKGGDIIDVMKRIAGTADMAKMNFKEAAALGSTFLSLGAKAEVAGSASNAMIRELATAKMQSKRFQGGMAMLGLNSADVQRGMNTDATATIIKVLEKIKALKGDAQLEAATRLFGKEYGDDAAKLAANLDEYRRQLKLVNDEKARGSMQRESDARGQTLQARMDIAKNAFTNLSSDLGEHLKPAIVATLEKTLSIIQAVRAWADENPRLAGGLMTVVKWVAGALGVLGLLTMAAGAVLVPLAMMKFALVTLGLSGASMATLWAAIPAVLGTVGSAISGVLLAGLRLVAANPIGLAIALAVYAVTKLIANFDELKSRFNQGDWAGIGMMMVRGIESGLDALTFGLYSKAKNLSLGLINTVKETLGIRSPSRVFTELGMHTMAGLSKGLEDNEDGPLKALGGAAKKLTAIGAGIVIGSSSPVVAAAPAGAGNSGGNTYHITIQAAAGSDHQALAELVAREIERIEAGKSARQRSRLRDME